MKSKTVSEIIRSFAKGHFPAETSSIFQKWILKEDSSAEKLSALEDLWKEAGDCPLEDGLVENPYDLVACADSSEASGKRRSRFRRILLVASGVAASVAILFGVYMAGSFSGSEICLASAPRSKGYFELPDSSKVWLNSGSRLVLSKSFTGRVRRVSLEGEGYFEVSKNPKRPFVVHTEKMDITVLGTKFSVMAYKDRPFLACLAEGSVSVKGENLPATLMSPGDLLFEDGGEWSQSKVRVSNFIAWAGDEMYFDELCFIDIAKSLEHWYNVKISLGNEELFKDIRLSLTVRHESLVEILEAIEIISGIHFRVVDADHIMLFLDNQYN